MIQEAIYQTINGSNLPFDTAKAVMEEMMEGSATKAQMGVLLTALRMKGESIDEITACATVMREKALSFRPETDVIDIVGTGGDEAGTFNISTTAAFVVAAAGLPVAKHGNRSVSSKSGAADVLEELGVNLNISAERSEKILKQTNMCFMFAQIYHSSMKNVAPVRKEMGVRTIFNILGPLSNPAGATLQLLGVYDRELLKPLAEVLSKLGVKRGMVVCGEDGLDEITLSGKTNVYEIDNGQLRQYEIAPEQFGFQRCSLEELAGGMPGENAQITRNILSGEKGPKRDVVVLNAACSLYVGGIADSIEAGVKAAEKVLDEGKALEKLEEFIRLTNETGEGK